MLTYNVRNLLDTQRKTSFANAIASTNFDVICITESWLTSDVPNSARFLQGYQIFGNDRQTTETHKTRHGGVVVAVRNTIKHNQLPVTCKEDDVFITQLLSATSTVIICCWYNAPAAPRAYQWTILELYSLLDELDAMGQQQQSDLIITGELELRRYKVEIDVFK